MTENSILPGATLGMLGGGQLGRMFAQAAQQMGYRVHVFCPEADCPAAQAAAEHTCANYDDMAALDAFAADIAVCSLEFENIPVGAVERVARNVPVRPGARVLHITQDRLREKSFLSNHDISVVPFRPVDGLDSLREAIDELGTPCVLKTSACGYDGKGQTKINDPNEAEAAWESIGKQAAVLEAWVTYEAELSIIAARSPSNELVCFPLFHNEHENHILDVTTCPAPFDERVSIDATELAERVVTALDYVGLLCIELFLEPGGRLLVNEIAPRPHNSGHLTIEAAHTSQFEQQVRAVCNLPLGAASLRVPGAAMANLLGHHWTDSDPDWRSLLGGSADDDAGGHLHLYGKAAAKPGRKMGHLTVTDASPDAARARVRALRSNLG